MREGGEGEGKIAPTATGTPVLQPDGPYYD